MTSVLPQRVLSVRDGALLVEYDSLESVLSHFAALEQADLRGVHELIPAAKTILIRYDPWVVTGHEIARILRQTPAVEQQRAHIEPVLIDVVYSGDDIVDVANDLGVSIDELIQRHTQAEWRGAFVGFAPGFVYCVSNDPLFEVSRKATPRTRIPSGSVALASNFSAIYPRESPGGWQLIGRTDYNIWDLNRETPAAIQPGQYVRYRPVRELVKLTDGPPSASKLPETSDETPLLEIIRPGLQLVLQDMGRKGLAKLGVPPSGAADRYACRQANRTVGNPAGSAALEIVGGGAEFRTNTRGVICLLGAQGPASIISTSGETFPLQQGQPTPLEAGDHIKVGEITGGLRSYIAIRGGFALEPILASLATDTLSGIGPGSLRAGDRLPLMPLREDVNIHVVQPLDKSLTDLEATESASSDAVELDIVLGPRTDWFTEKAVEILTEQQWTVSSQVDRVGVRLEGELALERAVTCELPSEGAVTGAIQVPPSGQPVLFLPDHPVTGGYPVIGGVTEQHIDRLGQLTPGDVIRFRVSQPFTEY